MGLYDRDWTREQDESQPPYASQMRFGLPSITPAVKWLLIINTGVFLLEWVISGPETPGVVFLEKVFALYPATPALTLQVWRLITYQFLHSGFLHIFFNMLGLLFLGPPLERLWGTRKFLFFYLLCGAAGGVFYILLVYAGFLMALPMIGASGAILGVLTACAILFPHFVVFLIIFPVSIRVAAIIMICFASLTFFFRGANAGGEAAHLAGIAAGAIYVFSDSWRTALKLRFKASRWDRHVEQEHKLRIEVDRILKKVHDSGLHSLTASEKRTLKKATKLEQTRSKP
ncbi:MAG: rhomboid family intramembrane serine protease [Sedimentisphaerales bacterium]